MISWSKCRPLKSPSIFVCARQLCRSTDLPTTMLCPSSSHQSPRDNARAPARRRLRRLIRSLAVYSVLARDAREAKRRRGLNSFDEPSRDAPCRRRPDRRSLGLCARLSAVSLQSHIRAPFTARPECMNFRMRRFARGLSARVELDRWRIAIAALFPLAERGDILGISSTNAIAKYGLTQLPSPRELAEI
jgi:hypothetical protein